MEFQIWTIYLLAAFGLSLTPGPNGLLSLTHGMRFGIGRAIYTILGGVLGFLLLIAASMAGMGALLATSETAFTVAKYIGAAYLVYLGIRTWRSPAPQTASLEGQPSKKREDRAFKLFSQGFLVATSNPKALIFFAAFLPQFMNTTSAFWLQFLILGGTFALVELLCELTLAGTAQRIAPWLGRNGRWFNRISGLTFISIGGVLATVQRNQAG